MHRFCWKPRAPHPVNPAHPGHPASDNEQTEAWTGTGPRTTVTSGRRGCKPRLPGASGQGVPPPIDIQDLKDLNVFHLHKRLTRRRTSQSWTSCSSWKSCFRQRADRGMARDRPAHYGPGRRFGHGQGQALSLRAGTRFIGMARDRPAHYGKGRAL